MNKKKLLLVTSSFPPDSNIGAVRPFLVAKTFITNGWAVDVGTTDNSSKSQDNYYAKDRDFEKLNIFRLHSSLFNALISCKKSRLKLLNILQRIFSNVVFIDDQILFLYRFLRFFLARARYDLIISTSPPFSMHFIAWVISRIKGVDWLADNRDLWAVSAYRRLNLYPVALKKYFEAKIMMSAICLTTATSKMADYYMQNYKLESNYYYTGFYSGENASKSAGFGVNNSISSHLRIHYYGSLYGLKRSPEILLDVIREDIFIMSHVELHLYGVDKLAYKKISVKNDSFVILHPHMARDELNIQSRKADLFLIVLANNGSEDGVVPGKFFEYLKFGKPILALAEDKTELASIINDFSLGLASADKVLLARYLTNIINDSRSYSPNPSGLESLSFDRQIGRMYRDIQTKIQKQLH